MNSKKRYIKVGNAKVEVDRSLYREYDKLRKRQIYSDRRERNNASVCVDELIPDTPGVEELVIDRLRVEELNKSLAQLADDEIFIISELFYKGVSERSLAIELGISHQLLNRKKHLILNKLRGYLENL